MDGPNLQPDPLVEKLIPDLSEQYPGTRVVSGFLGQSQQKGYWRLYLSPALDVYLEISEEDIVHSHSLASESNPLGGTILWIRPEADPELHTRAKLSQRQAGLLTGGASTQNIPQAAGQAATPDDATALAAFQTQDTGVNRRNFYSWIICPPDTFFMCPISNTCNLTWNGCRW